MDSSDRSHIDLIENLELQITEIDMLNSMYPSSSEFKITLPHILADIHRFIDRETKYIPNEVDFILNLQIPDVKDKLEMNVTLPHLYPTRKPVVICRSNGLSRMQQKELNSLVQNYVKNLPENELCMISLISWLSENAGSYFSLECLKTEAKSVSEKDSSTLIKPLCRMWIYSHHIYNKLKRRDIVDSAHDLKLTGFSLPGKPGFICIEGAKRDCDDFLQSLKQLSWKKLSLVKEEFEVKDSNSTNFRKFDKFQEISFQVRKGPAKEYHMDMGQFLKYLEEHNCAYAFNDLFGLEGHISSDK